MDYKEFSRHFKAWKNHEVNVVGDRYSPQDARFFDDELFFVCARQGTSEPKNTIWNDDYLWENQEAVERFLAYLAEKKK